MLKPFSILDNCRKMWYNGCVESPIWQNLLDVGKTVAPKSCVCGLEG